MMVILCNIYSVYLYHLLCRKDEIEVSIASQIILVIQGYYGDNLLIIKYTYDIIKVTIFRGEA